MVSQSKYCFPRLLFLFTSFNVVILFICNWVRSICYCLDSIFLFPIHTSWLIVIVCFGCVKYWCGSQAWELCTRVYTLKSLLVPAFPFPFCTPSTPFLPTLCGWPVSLVSSLSFMYVLCKSTDTYVFYCIIFLKEQVVWYKILFCTWLFSLINMSWKSLTSALKDHLHFKK